MTIIYNDSSLHIIKTTINHCSEKEHNGSRKFTNLNEKAIHFEVLSKGYLSKKQYVQALKALEKSAEIYRQLEYSNQYWMVVKNIGYVYYEMGQYTQSLRYYLKALKYFEDKKDWENISLSNNNIGILFHRQREFERALLYYYKAEKILKEHNKVQEKIYTKIYTNIGLTYYELKKYHKAEEYYLKALSFNEQLLDKQVNTVITGNLASVYRALKKYKKSEEYFYEAIDLSKEMNDEMSEMINYGDLGSLYINMAEEQTGEIIKQELRQKAINNLNKALAFFKKNNELRRFSGYSGELSKVYALSGNFKKAFNIYKQHILYKDSVFNDENRKELSRIEINYEFERREDSIRMVSEKNIAVKDALLEVNKKQKGFYTAGLFLLIVIGGLLFYQNYHRKKNNKRLYLLNEELKNANQIKTKLLGVLNHDLRSPISNIIKLIRLQQNSPLFLDEQLKERLQKQTLESAENLLVSMEDLLLWSKGQMKNFKPQFQKVDPKEVFNDIKLFFNYPPIIKMIFKNPDELSIFTDQHYLKIIMRNLTSNALKAVSNTSNPILIWEVYKEKKVTVLSISDNGKGTLDNKFKALFDEDYPIGINSGLGLHLIRDMVKAINGIIEVESTNEKGIVIKIFLKTELK